MPFDRQRYESAHDDYEGNWKATDIPLYRICRDYPQHQNRGGVNAKLWLIGRTYATGIERKIRSDGTQGSSMTKLAQHLWENHADVDGILRQVRVMNGVLDLTRLLQIISAHGKLVTLVQSIVRDRQSARSFASKYMHFHAPIVPIFDSVTNRVLTHEYHLSRCGSDIISEFEGDDVYGTYVQRFWELYKDARSAGVHPSIKLLDNYLLALGRAAR
jgi:hypothetical protein